MLSDVGCAVFNRPLNDWDVSRVKTLHESLCRMMLPCIVLYMLTMHGRSTTKHTPLCMVLVLAAFYDARMFNQPLGKWDTSNVETMSGSTWAQYRPALTLIAIPDQYSRSNMHRLHT